MPKVDKANGTNLNMRILGLVPLEVHLKISLGGESVSTHVALEWSLTGVRPDMNLKRGVRAKYLATETASVPEGI